jgi:hypothetical protein
VVSLAYKEVSERLKAEKLKTDAAGVGGALVGVAAGEYLGKTVGKTVAPTDVKKQTWISMGVKVLLGLALLFTNAFAGLAGIFVLGVSWGILGSISIDLFAIAAEGGLVGMAEASAEALRGTAKEAARAGRVYVDAAGNISTQAPVQVIPPKQIQTYGGVNQA